MVNLKNNNSDIRQSDGFAAFMEELGWKTKITKAGKMYLRKFPVIGCFAKMPRPNTIPEEEELKELTGEEKVFAFKIAPNITNENPNAEIIRKKLTCLGLKTELSPFNPTVTIHISLESNFDDIFSSFASAKRRAVRRALKNGVSVSTSDDFSTFIGIRKKQYSPMGFLVTGEMKALKKYFHKSSDLLLAHKNGKPLAGIFLIYHKKIAYYWYASSLKEGKKLFAPSLLVFEAIKKAMDRGCKIFDFEGIYDPRFPEAAESWKGFTKFKEGFGGKTVKMVENFTT